jgi:hypothetical protein
MNLSWKVSLDLDCRAEGSAAAIADLLISEGFDRFLHMSRGLIKGACAGVSRSFHLFSCVVRGSLCAASQLPALRNDTVETLSCGVSDVFASFFARTRREE